MNENSQNSTKSARVLVTGAAGHIGRHVLEELKEQGYQIRAVTSRALTPEHKADATIEWRQQDFMQSLEVDSLVQGCDAVLHLAATLWDIPKMPRLNVELTRLLAEAANRRGLRFFGFASSITVYGSAKSKNVDEATPLMTGDQDIAGEYRGNPSARAYARSKVQAEKTLATAAPNMECVIFRPTLVIDLPIILNIAQRSALKHFLLGKRHEHHIYVKDTAHAMVWFMRHALDRATPKAGIEIYNLADDDAPAVTGEQIKARAFELTRAPQFRPMLAGPIGIYNLIDMASHKQPSARYPFGMMHYSTKKLMATGYRFKYGLAEAQRLAFKPFMLERSN